MSFAGRYEVGAYQTEANIAAREDETQARKAEPATLAFYTGQE